jgi:hypothetical protein
VNTERVPDRATSKGVATEHEAVAFSSWLSEQLALKDVSRYKLAVAIDVSSHTVFRWLSGETSPSGGAWRALTLYFEVPEGNIRQAGGHR